MKLFIKLIVCLLGILGSYAMDTGQQIFYTDPSKNARTLSVYNPDDFMAPPVIRLGTSDRLNINFDIIGDDIDFLRYKIIHCNADWQPSRLMESEYINNFNEVEIDDYAFSSNTYIHYVNYNISIPNPDLPILHSGNYLLQVFPEYENDNVLLQARFSISEQKSPIKGGITTKTDQGTDTEFQQLFLNLDISSLPDINPYQDLIITVTQNNRPETMRMLNHPIRVAQGNVVYEHSPQLIFEAGNEYRRFETVRTDYPGMHVEAVKFDDGIWQAWINKDEARTHKEYSYDSTQHGRFKIDEYNSTDPDLSADYVMVHFTLDPIETQKGIIFVDGDFTNHQFDESNMMRYDWNDGLYHADIPLKQGSYNYQYVVVPDNGGLPSPRNIEGNKYETQNEYLVQAFLRSPGSRGDRLIGSVILK